MRQLASRIKVMSDLDITRTRRPQDGRILALVGQRRIEFRVSVVPCQGGEKIVLRVITPDNYLGNLANLVVSEPLARFVESIFDQPSGLVLVTGPAGAGKTTTLYAALNLLNMQQQTRNIVTIEDPIEYNLDYATQIQVNLDLGLDFSDILRSVLRQDPNIILVGEIRDEKSAAIAVEAATTGHLVLSSLHTHSALETLARLRNLDVKPYLLASALRGVISQHLVPRLAPGFTQPVPPDDPVVQRLKRLEILEPDWRGPLWRGKHTKDGPPEGEAGRLAVYEILSVSDTVRDLIDRSAVASEIRQAVDDDSFFSFARYSRLLLADGLVSPESIEKIFPKKPTLAMFES
jgi:general secretion pathway protein E